MNFIITFPENAAFGKPISKNKVFENAQPSVKVKEMFVREVEQINWAYKLAPETINLAARPGIQELQIISIVLKRGELPIEILQCIDKTIPSPLFFQISYNNQIKYICAYKRPNVVEKEKWIVCNYFSTDWINDTAEKKPLPVALDLGMLYFLLLQQLAAVTARSNEKIDEFIQRVEDVRKKEREIEKTTSQLHNEKQFNRKVEINQQLRVLNDELEELRGNHERHEIHGK